MKETEWRSKLVRQFKEAKPGSFIWTMDAKFKAGFPDLYIVDLGVCKHIELKVFSSTSGTSLASLRKFFDPIQISVMRSINKAGGYAIGMALNKATNNVYLFDPTNDLMFILSPERFKAWWTATMHSWEEAEAA